MELTPTQLTFWSTAWLAAGWLLNHFLTVGRDRSKRLRDFRNQIAILSEKFRIAVPIDLDIEHASSIRKVSETCLSIKEDVRRWRRKRFELIRVAYCGLKQQDIENKDISKIFPERKIETIHELFAPSPLCDYEKGRRRILQLLSEMRDFAK
jgi:hypothetical protein